MKLPPMISTRFERSAASMMALVSSRVWKPYTQGSPAAPGQGGGLGWPPVATSSAS